MIYSTNEKPTAPAFQDGVVTIKTACIEESVTQPKNYYDESSMVRAMEKAGIGRPSTYVAVIDKLFTRHYVEKKKIEPINYEASIINYTFKQKSVVENVATKQISVGSSKKDAFVTTDLGNKVVTYLQGVVPSIIDAEFTSDMEKKLDAISEGVLTKTDVLTDFYSGFSQSLAAAETDCQNVATKQAVKEFPSLNAEIRLTKYGYSLFETVNKRYVSIEPFLLWKKIAVSDMGETDARFLLSLPLEVPDSKKQVCIGRYGLYLKEGAKNMKLERRLWQAVYDGDLTSLTR